MKYIFSCKVKRIYIISFLLLVISNGFGQVNGLENKHKPIELTEKEFFDNSISVDTILRQKFHSNGVVSEEELIWRLYSNNFGDTLLWWLDRKIYRPSAQIQQHITYSLDFVKEIFYDKEDIMTFKVTTEYEFKDPTKRVYKISSRGGIMPVVYSREYINYHNGRIKRRGITMNMKKNGVWEYYNKETGELEKTITYKMGKKISTKRIIN